MSARAFNRWQAAGTHLGICVLIALAVVTLMLAAWYPRPLFEAAGGNDLLFILVGVDVVIGPLCTLVIFRSGKWGLKFDLAVIALLQVAALVYGVYIVYLARPAFIVFVKDRFELATAVELAPEELAAAKYAEFRTVPLSGPQLAVAQMPQDAAGRRKIMTALLAGLDLHHFPGYYAPYAEHRKEVLAKADTVARLRKSEPEIARVVDQWLASSGTREDAVRVLLLRTRFAWIAVLIDPATAEPLKMLLAQKIG